VTPANRRYYRTVLLGIAAMAALVWSAIDQFDLAPQEMLSLFMGIVIAIVSVIALAAVCAGLWVSLRSLLRGRSRDNGDK